MSSAVLVIGRASGVSRGPFASTDAAKTALREYVEEHGGELDADGMGASLRGLCYGGVEPWAKIQEEMS